METHLAAEMQPEGKLTVAVDPTEAVAQLEKQAPDKWGVALVWQGYGGPEDRDHPEAQGNKLSAFVRVPVGLPAIPGNTIHREIPGGHDSVLERIEWVNVSLRRLRFNSTEIEPRPLRLVRSGWYRKEDGTTTRVHELEYEIVTVLDEAAETVVLEVP